VLTNIDLVYVLRNDHVVITTADTGSSTMDTVFYPVPAGVNVDEVAVLLEEIVFPESWSHVRGAGTIIAAPVGLRHGLVVSHNSDAHEEIEAALCNDSLPHGADADARIEVIGKSLVVRSHSRPFQVIVAQIITAVVGEELELEIESDEATPASVSASDT